MRQKKSQGERINHMVLMGIGEPFDNYENIAKFLRLATAKEALGLSMRNLTVSTCGHADKIINFAKDFPQAGLAISLHATTDEGRSKVMPINKKFPLDELLKSAWEYTDITHRRITFEYALVKGVNDGDEDLKRLADICRGKLCHVNLIPLNKVEGTGFDTVSRKRAREFAMKLEGFGISATVRRELGADIDGACGQLRLKRM